jgi:hypothetical protein
VCDPAFIILPRLRKLATRIAEMGMDDMDTMDDMDDMDDKRISG